MRKKSATVFYDIKFRDSIPSSLAMVSSTGQEFYSVFTEFNGQDLPDIAGDNTLLYGLGTFKEKIGSALFVKGPKEYVLKALHKWLSQFKLINFWSDKPEYHDTLMDVLSNTDSNFDLDICAGTFDVESTLVSHGFSSDVDREAFIDSPVDGLIGSTLYNAKIVESCYYKLYRNGEKYARRMESLKKGLT